MSSPTDSTLRDVNLTDLLAQVRNPFAGAVVSDRDIYTGDMPDVESIHRNARAALREGLSRSRGGSAHLLVITGEAGDGKTHLLAWLRRQEGEDFLFVAVPPMPDPAEPFRHTLRHVMARLRRRRGAPGAAATDVWDTPLSRLVWEILYLQACDLLDAARTGLYEGPPTFARKLLPLCEEAGEPRGALHFATEAGKLWPQLEGELGKYLAGMPAESALDAVVRSVLLKYPDPDRRALCAAWLSGEDLGEVERARLSVKQVIDNEAASRRLLTAFCRLSPVPVVLCFDQIEGITDRLRDPGLRALAEVVAEVHAQGGRTCQVVSCHAGVWGALSDKLAVVLGDKGPGKPEKVALSRIEPDQVRDLLVARLGVAFALAPASLRPAPLYPFTDAEVLEAVWSAGISNAREALRHFEGEFERRRDALVQPGQDVNASNLPPPVTDAGVVEAAYQAALGEVRAGFADTLPGARASTLRAVVKELCDGLRHLGPGDGEARGRTVAVMSCDPILGGGLRLTVQKGGGAARRAALEICNADMGPAVYSAASRLARQVKDGRADLALLVREEKLPLGSGPNALKAEHTIDGQLGGQGGFLWLSEEDTVELLGIERVLHAASAGELSAGPRTIGRAEALDLLLQREGRPPAAMAHLLGKLHPGTEAPPAYGSPGQQEPAVPVAPSAASALAVLSGPNEAPQGERPEVERAPEQQRDLPIGQKKTLLIPAIAGPRTTQTGMGIVALPAAVPVEAPIDSTERMQVPPGTRPAQPAASTLPSRPTLTRFAAIPLTAQGLTSQHILQTIGERAMVEERLLALELGIPAESLTALLDPLLAQGVIRISTSREGRRIVFRRH